MRGERKGMWRVRRGTYLNRESLSTINEHKSMQEKGCVPLTSTEKNNREGEEVAVV